MKRFLDKITELDKDPAKRDAFLKEIDDFWACVEKNYAELKKKEENLLQNKNNTETAVAVLDQKVDKDLDIQVDRLIAKIKEQMEKSKQKNDNNNLNMERVIEIIREELKKSGADTLSDETVDNCIRTIQKEKIRGRPRNPKLVWDMHPLTPKVRELH